MIDGAKAKVEKTCPGAVSCTDILSVAARDASVAVGGLSWSVMLEMNIIVHEKPILPLGYILHLLNEYNCT